MLSWFQRNFDACVMWVFILIMAGLFVTAYKLDAVQPLWADEMLTRANRRPPYSSLS